MSTGTASTFNCPHCDRQFRWKAEIARQKVKCKCGEKFHVPETAPINRAAAVTSAPRPAAAAIAAPDPEEDSPLLYALAEVTAPKPAPPPRPVIARTPAPAPGMKSLPPRVVKAPTPGGPAGKLSPTSPFARGLPPAPPPPPEGGVGLKITGIGLLLHFIGFLAVIGGAGTAAAATFLLENPGLSLVGIIVGVSGFGLTLLGPFLYLAAPSAAGRGLIIAALAAYLTVCGLFGYLVMQLTQAGAEPDGLTALLLSLAVAICIFTGHACLLGFYSKLAEYLGNNTLADNATTLVKLFGWSIGLSFLRWIPVLGCFISAGVLGLQAMLLVGYVIVTGQLAVACLKR